MVNKVKVPYTANEIISLLHKNTARYLRDIAKHIQTHQQTTEQIIQLLLESADELDAQSMVVELRDTL